MRISIVTPSYNQGQYIEQTIRMVIHQRLPDYEHIIVDAGSTDHTGALLHKYKKYIRLYVHKGEGQVQAINWGLRRATGDIVTYINADDYYLPGALDCVAKIFFLNPRIRWLTGDYAIVNERAKSIQKGVAVYKKIFRQVPSVFSLLLMNYIAQPSTFWAKSVMGDIGYFDPTLRYAFDYDFWLRMMRRYPLCVMPEKLSAFRIHNEAKGWKHYHLQFKEDEEVVRRYTNNPAMVSAHRLHNRMIVWMYDRMKR